MSPFNQGRTAVDFENVRPEYLKYTVISGFKDQRWSSCTPLEEDVDSPELYVWNMCNALELSYDNHYVLLYFTADRSSSDGRW